MTKLKVFSTFTGIGGFELGLIEALGEGNLEFVGYSEIDKYAIQVYNYHFPNHTNYGNIKTIESDKIPDFDLLVGGFPCQSHSISGLRGGFEDPRGELFFDLLRILRDKRPRYFIFENVKGLLSSESGKAMQTILQEISKSGYDIQWSVHNSRDYGVAQNRERLYIIGHLRTLRINPPQVLPLRGANQKTLKQLTREQSQGNRVYDPSGVSTTLSTNSGGLGYNTGLYAVGAIRGRYNEDNQIEQQLEVKEAVFVKEGRSEEGKEIRRKNKKELGIDSNPFRAKETKLVPQVYSNTLTSAQKDNLLLTGFKIQEGQIIPTDISTCIDANYHKGLDNHGQRTGVLSQPKIISFQNRRTSSSVSDISGTLTSRYAGGIKGDGRPAVIEPFCIDYRNKRKMLLSPTLLGNDHNTIHTVAQGLKIRRLVPVETEALQGFSRNWTSIGLNEKGEQVNISDSQRYKMCGNAVSVPVVAEIAKQLFKPL